MTKQGPKADLTKQPEQVAAMFDQVAVGYDLTNAVLSAGNAALWRISTTRAIAPKPGEYILDLAAGTGTSSAAIARFGAYVVAADFSIGMVEVGTFRHGGNPLIDFVQADGMALPFTDNSFDAVTISFGLRNILDPHKALSELFRVLKPGGRIVICEFSTPPVAFIRNGYWGYLRYVMPTLVRAVSTNEDAYDYLFDSIKDWPNQRTLAAWMREAGFAKVEHRNLTEGIVALHRAVKP